MPKIIVRAAAWALMLAAGVAPRLLAQAPVRTFLLMSSKDTISVERVTRSPGRLEGELLFRVGNQRWHYIAIIGPDERVVSMENEFRFASDAASAPARQTAHFVFAGDSVFVSVTSPTSRQERLASRSGAVPYINPSFGLAEQAVRRGMRMTGDSTAVPLFALAGGVTTTATVTRLGSDSLVFSVSGVPTRLRVSPDGSIRGGAIPLQGLRLEVVDGTRAEAFITTKPDYSAPAGAPYRAIAVRVPTSMGHSLAGTLTLPTGTTGPVPAVVTITGSGPEDRDEAILPVKGYRPFREVADALGRRGIAVLRMDDRGFGESEGTFATSTSRDFADDIRAGLAFLRSRPEIDGKRLALVGHSEGGLIAPMIAETDPALRGIVLMAGPGYTGRKILEYQNRYALDHMDNLTPKGRDSLMTVALRILDSTATSQEWMRFFLAYDPVVTARRVKTPVLILQGATDRQVTPDQPPALERAFRAGGNSDVTVHLYPETNHLFVPDPDGSPSGYTALKITAVRPEVLRDIADWLSRRLHGRRPGERRPRSG